MPTDENALIMQPIVVIAEEVCTEAANRLHGTNYRFSDISGHTLAVAFKRPDNDFGRLKRRVEIVEQRFRENLAEPDTYKPIKFSANPQAGQIGGSSTLRLLTLAFAAGAK